MHTTSNTANHATQTKESAAIEVAERYYDSNPADMFYYAIWGGEDIHVGLYEGEEPIRDASRRTVETMVSMLARSGSTESSNREVLDKNTKVLDLGSGYGGAARFLSTRFECQVTCLNLSQAQNKRNRELNASAKLLSSIDVIYGNFESLPFANESFDVVWSQDAFLHSSNRNKVMSEAARVLRRGGRLIFTDPMQRENAPADALQPIYQRIHLESLASFSYYRRTAESVGLKLVEERDLSEHLGRHYGRVRQELLRRRAEMVDVCGASYIDNMLEGLGHWVTGQQDGHLTWGIILLEKK